MPFSNQLLKRMHFLPTLMFLFRKRGSANACKRFFNCVTLRPNYSEENNKQRERKSPCLSHFLLKNGQNWTMSWLFYYHYTWLWLLVKCIIIKKMFSLIPYRKFGMLYLGKVKAAIRAELPIPTVCTVLLCSTMVWPSVFGADVCNYILGPYEHCKRVCTESWLWEKKYV